MKHVLLTLSLMFFVSCNEAPLFNDNGLIEVNAPIDIAQIPGTSIALVLNSNVNLSSSIASMAAIDLTNNTLNTEKSIAIPNFASSIEIDDQRQLILVGDRANDLVEVFDYDLGTGGIDQLTITPRNINSQLEITNGIKADEEPSNIQLYTDINSNVHAIVSNYIDGTLSFLNLDTFAVQDLFPADTRFGLPLIGLTAFDLNAPLLGVGAGRISLDPSNDRFAYVASFLNNVIFVVDLWDQEIEETIPLGGFFSSNGLRDLLIDSNQQLFFLHQANDSLNKIDISQVLNNNILLEEMPVALLDQVSLPSGAEYMALSPNGQELWVNLYDLNQIWVFNANTLAKVQEVDLNGLGPAKIIFSENGNFAYICEFLSNSVAVVSTSTYLQTASIQ